MPGAPGSHPSACNSRASPQVRGLALLAAVGEGHGAGPRREAESDLATAVEKRVHISENGSRVEEFLGTRAAPRPGSACHRISRPRGRPLAARPTERARAAPLGGQLGSTHADLAEMLLVRSHGGDGGALACLQLGTEGIEAAVAQLTKRVGSTRSPRGGSHRYALYSQPGSASRRVRVHLLYDARSRHRIEGGTARGSGSP